MKEKDWVKSITGVIEKKLRASDDNLRVVSGHRLPYTNEIRSYNSENSPDKTTSVGYETDIIVFELLGDTHWLPRIIIETKLGSVSTHDAITYSQKAQSQKLVHPYLRYGILIGNREDYPLPGRLFRHGQHFDFMLSWKLFEANKSELKTLINILNDEIIASRTLEEILYNSRSKNRQRFTSLHRPLRLEK